MYKTFTALITLGMAAAAPSHMMSRQDAPRKLLIGTPAQIISADYTGDKFDLTSKYYEPGTGPSWLLYREPNLVYAVNENGNEVNLFTLGAASAGLTLDSTVNGSSGVVSLAFNEERTRIVGASYGAGTYDVWDVQADNSLKLFKTVKVEGPLGPDQPSHRPHQALLDPSGRYFVIPNLGGDTVLVVDSENNSYEITNTVQVGSGTGPRHGGFLCVSGGRRASHYVVATELSNELVLYNLEYDDAKGTIDFAEAQRLSTYGPGFPPANATTAAAGELVISNDGGHIYVSNRLSGNETDSIAHFLFQADGSAGGAARLRFADTVSSGGILPRMFSLGTDAEQAVVFVANQAGDHGVAAFSRDPATGSIDATPLATVPLADLIAPNLVNETNVGPQFIQEI